MMTFISFINMKQIFIHCRKTFSSKLETLSIYVKSLRIVNCGLEIIKMIFLIMSNLFFLNRLYLLEYFLIYKKFEQTVHRIPILYPLPQEYHRNFWNRFNYQVSLGSSWLYHFLRYFYFWWPWWFWGILVRYIV